MTVLNIYSEKDSLDPSRRQVVLLDPFWGAPPEEASSPANGRFDEYIRLGHDFFRLTDWDRANIVVAPNEWAAGGPNEAARALSARALAAGKPAVLFFNHDSDEEIAVEGAFVFRTSFARSRRRENEFAFPAWSEDFLRHTGGGLAVRPKAAKPRVGYCGYAAPERAARQETFVAPLRRLPGGGRLLRALGLGVSGHRGLRLRSEALRRLAESARVEADFLRRRAFWNGALSGTPAPLFIQQTRREFVQNMVGSDYILCVRGAGNFSYRLYETLSCGRIPVFLDTDCALPYDQWIDWRRLCVWVEEGDVAHIAERVAAFHAGLSPAEFQERQRECRRVWEEWLSPTGFFANFHRHFGPSPSEQGPLEQGRPCAS